MSSGYRRRGGFDHDEDDRYGRVRHTPPPRGPNIESYDRKTAGRVSALIEDFKRMATRHRHARSGAPLAGAPVLIGSRAAP